MTFLSWQSKECIRQEAKVLLTVISNGDCQQVGAEIQFLVTRREQGLERSFTTSDVHRKGVWWHYKKVWSRVITTKKILSLLFNRETIWLLSLTVLHKEPSDYWYWAVSWSKVLTMKPPFINKKKWHNTEVQCHTFSTLRVVHHTYMHTYTEELLRGWW